MSKTITSDDARAALRGAKNEIITRGGVVSGHGTVRNKDGKSYDLVVHVLSQRPDFNSAEFDVDGVHVRPKLRDIPELASDGKARRTRSSAPARSL